MFGQEQRLHLKSFGKKTNSSLALAIINTLRYFQQFNFPLTKNELYWRLPIKVSKFQLDNQLQQLLAEKKIIQQQPYFTLAKASNSFAKRFKRKTITQQKELEAVVFLNFAKKLPFIRGVAFTGSMASYNADARADLDFLIITAKNRLWLSRFLVLLFAIYHQRRPKLHQLVSNQWDFNLWLEANSLAMPDNRQSLYEAYELLQLRWLVDKDNLATGILQANRWLQKILPNCQLPKNKQLIDQHYLIDRRQLPNQHRLLSQHSPLNHYQRQKKDWFSVHFLLCLLAKLGDLFFTILNSLLYFLQKNYRGIFHFKHGIGKKQAFFHLGSSKRKYLRVASA